MANLDVSISVPGDKSTSTRALLLALLAEGQSSVDNVPLGRTTDRVVAVLRQLGAKVDVVNTRVTVVPPAQLPSGATLDCGGSATLARILIGLLAGANVDAVVDGSAMLRRRPMDAVRNALAHYFGRDVVSLCDGCLPARIHRGAPPTSTETLTMLGSAQIRSALCFASITARRPFPITGVTSSARRSFENLCAQIGLDPTSARVPVFDVTTPSDPSAEAFPIAAALALGRGLVVDGTPYPGLDRMGFQFAIRKMGAELSPDRRGATSVSDLMPANTRLLPRTRPLTGIVVAADPVVPPHGLRPNAHVYDEGLWMLMDEIPVLAALCALATTPSRLCGLAALRVKESDRISRTAQMLQAFGAAVVEEGDDLLIEPATLHAPRVPIRTDHDHRIAMTALTLARILDVGVELDDEDCVDESWRGFQAFIDDTVARLREQSLQPP